MIDPKAELFKWGPIDGRLIYIDYFMTNFRQFTEMFPPGWPETILHAKENKILIIIDYKKLRDNGAVLFNKYVMDKKELEKLYKKWIEIVRRLEEIQVNIENIQLETLTEEQLKELFNKWHKQYCDFWVYGFIPEVSNWGGEEILKNNIQDKENFIKIFERLSAPEELSFFQQEEYELLQLKLIDDKKELEKKLAEHQKKYFWIHNSYEDAQVMDVEFFRKRLEEISFEQAKKQIKTIEEFSEKVMEEKNKIMQEYDLPEELHRIGKALAFCIWWQDLRKRYIFMANHYLKLFLLEIGKRKSIPFIELCYHTVEEINVLVNKDKISDAKQRINGFALHCHDDMVTEHITGSKADKLIEKYTKTDVDVDADYIKGMPVSRGKAKGKVRILITPKQVGKMKGGEVLIAPMTSPDYIIAMRKAVAIVTDEGGMTCHAAIVARELGVPCIVATGIATKFFKNGEIIEVDGDSGIVKRV